MEWEKNRMEILLKMLKFRDVFLDQFYFTGYLEI